MNPLRVLCVLCFGLLVCASAGFARGSLSTWPHANNPILAARAAACTLDVVLVTFQNAGASTSRFGYQYHNYDRPFGEEDGGLTAASYRRRDFLRMLAGGYSAAEGGHPTPFVGPNVRVANNYRLPQVFGSVRAYFDSVSNGVFNLHVRMVNPATTETGTDDFPRWIELPNTKEHYAESTTMDEFWDAAYQATLDSLSLPAAAWNTGISLPHHTSTDYPFTRLLRRKLLFLYSGVVFNNRDVDLVTRGNQPSQLHPQADETTRENPTQAMQVGYRYVMGERQGFGNTTPDVDEFAGIGAHAHEIGHLLGLNHGEGDWADSNNRYGNTRRNNPPNMVDRAANQLGWTLMQGGGDQGPVTHNNAYYIAYRSCPNPINPFYLRDLGWLTPTEILNAQNDYAIAPGTTHLIDRGVVEFLLNRRTTQPFGGRYVSFYDYAAPNAADQGLMVWRRRFRVERPLLIVADERRYRDARDQDASPNIPEYYDMLSDPFAAGRISDPRDDPGDDTNFDQANVSAVNSLTAGAGLRQATTGGWMNRDPGDVNLALTDIRYDAAGDNILVDVALTLPAAPDNLTAEVQAGQVTLRWAASNDPTVSYRYRYRPDTMLWSGWSMTTATENGRIVATIEAGDLINNTAYTFEVAAVNGLGRNSATLTATPQALGPSAVDFVEDVTPDQDDTEVATYTVTGLGNTPNWTLENDTRNAFELQGTGTTRELHFRQPPDFETLQNATYSVTIQARAGQVTVTQAVSVTVVNAEEEGSVSLTGGRPEVGQVVVATLTDPDGVVGVPVWWWERGSSTTDTWTEIALAHAESYKPQRDDIGYQLRATAHYTDRHGSNKSASGATSASVVGRPSAPREFEAVAGDGQVVLRWQPPASDGGLPIRRYKVVYFPSADRDASTGFSAVPGGASARDTTIEGLTNGTRYVFRVLAQNRDNNDGNGFRAEREATPQVPCQLTGEMAPTFAENATGAVGTYTASPGCDSALSWKLAGTDTSAFAELQGTGTSRTLEFKQPPNFEQPADAGKNNTYAVSVSIGDVSVPVTVSVTDANDAGVIRLSTTAPRAEESLTATLSDEDGIEEPVYWTPHYESTSDGGGVTGQASEATQTWTLTIPNSRVGQPLRIQADYTDSFGAASATSALTSPVHPASNRAPSVSGPASVDIAENSSSPWLLGTYIGRDPDGDELTWSITGTDASAFDELKEPASPGASPSRELHLANAADYETQARYDVWVKVSDAVLSDSLRVSVSVVNQNEDGSVVLTGGLPPEVGTAVVAGLTDPDGQITGASWQWQRRWARREHGKRLGPGCRGLHRRCRVRPRRILSYRATRRCRAMWGGSCRRRCATAMGTIPTRNGRPRVRRVRRCSALRPRR